jgi:hypothetical protein
MGRIKKFLREVARLNIDYIFDAMSWYFPNWLFYYYHNYLISADNPKLVVRTYATYFKRLASIDDLPLLKKCGISERFAREHLDAGDRCVIMGQNDKIMSIIWGCSGRRYLKLSGAILDPGEQGVIFYAGFTDEQARLKGLFPTSFNELYQSYVDEGRRRIYAGIHSLNTNSLKLHERMNFDIVGETYFLVLLGVHICYYKKWPYPNKKIHVFIKSPPENLQWV